MPGLASLLLPGSVLLLGEMHGTVESPAFAENAVCLALRADTGVTLGLEIPREEESLVEAFLASRGRPEDQSALLASPFWQATYQDGRRCRSRLALLESLRLWRQQGRRVRVLLFDRLAQPAGSGQERDRWMAESMKEAIQARPGDLFIALAGNVHMRIGHGVPWDAGYEPAGFLLARSVRERRIVALNVAYGQGTAWFCTSADSASCGVRSLRGSGNQQGTRVILYSEPRDGYNGVYNVGSLTASPPAVDPGHAAAAASTP